MEAKAGPARPLQDVDDAGATVENQLALVQKQLRAMMPELLSAIYLVGRHAGEVRRVEMQSILAARPQIPHRTGSDMENQEIDWNRMGHYLKMIMKRAEDAQANIETLHNVLGNKYVKKMLKDPKTLWHLAKNEQSGKSLSRKRKKRSCTTI